MRIRHAHVRPASVDDFERRQDAAGGRIVLVTLAPEVPGALDAHRTSGRRRACASPSATRPRRRGRLPTRLRPARRCPRISATAVAQVLPRHPNVIWEQLAADALLASLIVDGHHLPPATVKAMVRAKGPDRTILVTDAIAAAGCAPGRYGIGDVECELGADGRVSLPGTPFLAGSSLTLDRGDRQHGALHGAADRDRDPDGVDDSGRVPGHDARRHRQRRVGSRVGRSADLERDPHEHRDTRLGGPRRLPRRHHGDRPRSSAIASATAASTFLGGRKFGPWLMIGQSFGVGTHAEMPVALAGAVYSVGASAHLVSVEEPLHHAVLLDHGAGLPPHPPHDDGGVHRGSVRPVDGARSTSCSRCASSSSTPAACSRAPAR